jgi:hypothetical protein
VNQTEKQHVVAIALLERLGLDNIKLERRDGHYSYRAWNVPIIVHNGSPTTIKRARFESHLSPTDFHLAIVRSAVGKDLHAIRPA